jgi:hypothetical protein
MEEIEVRDKDECEEDWEERRGLRVRESEARTLRLLEAAGTGGGGTRGETRSGNCACS